MILLPAAYRSMVSNGMYCFAQGNPILKVGSKKVIESILSEMLFRGEDYYGCGSVMMDENGWMRLPYEICRKAVRDEVVVQAKCNHIEIWAAGCCD